MMKIKVDENNVDLSALSDKSHTLYDFISNDIAGFIPKGSVIKDIYLNGIKFDELLVNDEKTKTIRIDGDGELNVTTMTSSDLIKESIAAIKNYFNDLSISLNEVSDLLRVGNDKDGFNNFAADLKGIASFVQMMDKIAVFLKIDYSIYTYKEKTIKGYFDDLEETLSKILEMQKNRDYIMLADTIEFEMEPELEVWQEVLEYLKDELIL
ncbi:hypothetical protein ACMCNP_08035 [Candidatus Acidulodesulfobacterium sp. H_13]|uniref:hypothetical protein n=1 Tax=Candidatus Acidulodesulfobacterium sp. H_13 TaxID=3395470 RepID=UPI003AF437F3